MKKISLIILMLAVAGSAFAQSKLSFGIKGGVDFSNIIKTGDNDYNTDYVTGFNAGVFLALPIVDRLSFQPELMFSQKGYKADRTGYTVTQTTNWIEIPILAKISAARGFDIFLGPQVSFLTKTTNKFDGTLGSTTQTTYEDDADKFKKSILGGALGVGIGLTNNLSLTGRYNLDFQKNNEDGSNEVPEFKNQVWQVGLALGF